MLVNSYFNASLIQRESKKPSIGKEYFNHMNLEAIVTKYPYRKNLPEEEILKGYHDTLSRSYREHIDCLIFDTLFIWIHY